MVVFWMSFKVGIFAFLVAIVVANPRVFAFKEVCVTIALFYFLD